MRTPALCDTRSYAVAAVLKPRGALSRPQTLLDCSGRHALIASPHHVGFPSLQEVLAPAEAAPPADARDAAPVRECGIPQPGKSGRRSLLWRHRRRME